MKFLFLIFLAVFASCTSLPQKRTDKLSILQGVTGPKEVEFSIVAAKNRLFTFELRSAKGQIIAPEDVKIVSRDYSDYVVHKIIFIREEAVDYNLYVFENGNVVDQRLVGKGAQGPSRLRVAVASCMNDHYSKHFKIWDQVLLKNPQYMLLLGDNVYGDKSEGNKKFSVGPKVLWERYLDARLSLPFFFQQKLIATHAIWDDHDYGEKNGNSSYAYKDESKEIFQAFYAQDLSVENWTKGFGTGGLLSLGDFNLYFLDARSFRSSAEDGNHLGLDQEDWLLTKLREQPGPSFIVKGDQFFGGHHKNDSFEDEHSKHFTQFVEVLGKIDTPFVFLSGDRHLSEIMQFPRGLFKKPSFEITSGPMHAGLSKDNEMANPWRVVTEKDHVNFLIIDSVDKDNHWFLDVESIGEDGQVYFQRELAVYVKDLQDNLQEARKRRSGKRRYRRVRKNRK